MGHRCGWHLQIRVKIGTLKKAPFPFRPDSNSHYRFTEQSPGYFKSPRALVDQLISQVPFFLSHHFRQCPNRSATYQRAPNDRRNLESVDRPSPISFKFYQVSSQFQFAPRQSICYFQGHVIYLYMPLQKREEVW